MNINDKFTCKLLASAVASCAIAGMAGIAQAQTSGNDDMLEEVVVTGIRASLTRSMDIKRDARGVVDAISAEDIGKFPDTNLAESLQRISGVSIDRSNNEGSKITVRGFGPDYNLVLLNGRQMPTTGDSRSFEFGDVAAEIVSGVEVHKTFSANDEGKRESNECKRRRRGGRGRRGREREEERRGEREKTRTFPLFLALAVNRCS